MTRHADCQALLRDRRASSDSTQVDITKVPPAGLRRSVADDDGSLAQAEVDNRPFLFRDPPDHTRLRGLVAKAFTPKMIDGLRARTEAIVAELLDAALERGELDVVAELAYPLPVRIICEMLGVPVADHERFQGWSAALARGLDPEFLLTEEVIAARMEAITSFGLYLLELLAERRANPGDDLLSQLALAEEEGDTLSEEELISTAILLLVAGHETTVNLIAGGVLSLVQHPVQLERLRSDPSVVRSGVEEMLRYVSPVQLTGRTLLEPMTVGEADPEQPPRLRVRDPPLPGCAAGPSRGPGGHSRAAPARRDDRARRGPTVLSAQRRAARARDAARAPDRGLKKGLRAGRQAPRVARAARARRRERGRAAGAPRGGGR